MPDMVIRRINISDVYKTRLIAVLLYILSGCTNPDSAQKDTYLIRAGNSRITISDFNKSFESAKTAYHYDALQDPAILKSVRTELLKQLAERAILTERAGELRIDVSEAELEKAVLSAKEGYPDGEFEKTLLESAVSYDSWKTELKHRLLMEKVIEKDLEQEMNITAEDITKYNAENKEKKLISDEMMVKLLKKKKAEAAYPAWIEQLQKKYKVEINETEWKKIADS
ncbi:MAG: hypothetical protein BWK80_39325 [Desulfobacteraceae bacterium IS3]|jgi:hypothetical protein|nr:MAG: hypothetical protein BWK80_39325 [Desulfobacteraceae bacterium IS3]HAO20693.1 hypothetical protein [Desulfobacteraceae bacterium]